ncbi:MAG: T9SS type A sorting domain-containing protein [Brumimicrobium sp.]
MKKIYLLAIMTIAGNICFAQSPQKQMQKINFSKSTAKSPAVYEKTPGQVIWSSDFSTQADWIIGGNGAQGDWDMGTNADVPDATAYMGDMASTTFANGFGFFDGVAFLIAGSVDPQNAWLEMTNPIDLSGETNVIFSFEQRYRAFNSDITIVEVSVDNGATWTDAIDVNEDVLTNDPAIQSTVYQAFEVNGATQVKFRFRWENLSDDDLYGSGYGWFVDDVNVTTLPDNDIDASDLYYGTEGLFYYQIPEDQIAPIDFTVNAENVGINDQHGVALEATEISGSGYVGTSTPVSIAVQTSDSLVVNSAFTPPGQSTYDVQFSILNDSLDDVPLNNQIDGYSFEVGDYIYARDKDTAIGNVSHNVGFETGNLFDIWQTDQLTAINAHLASNIDVNGLEMFGRVYGVDAFGDFFFIDETPFYLTQPGDEDGFYTFVFTNPVTLNAGETYLVTVGSYNIGFSISNSGNSPDLTSFLYGDLGGGGSNWYYTNNTPMVRMNFEPCLSNQVGIDLDVTDAYCSGSCDGTAQDNDPNISFNEYDWYDSDSLLVHTGDQLSNVCAGDYYVIKEDTCGNSNQTSFTIGENAVLVGHSFNNQPASSCISSDGEIILGIDFIGSYFSSDLTIEVTGPSNEILNTAQNPTYSIPNLISGNYTVIVTDNENGCDPWVFTTTVPHDGSEQDLCVVTVDSSNSNQNIVVWEKPADLSQIDSFFVYREITTNSYQKVGAVHVDSLSHFVDPSANPNTVPSRYKISILNICGEEMTLSSYHNTIHLQYLSNGNFSWNDYEIENQTNVVDSYNFYRDNLNDGNWQIVQVVPGNQNTVIDSEVNTYPNARYYIDVNWNGTNSCLATKAQGYNTSRSNVTTAQDASIEKGNDLDNLIIRPNPTSDNLYIDNLEHLSDIKIFSSIGQVVFEEEDFNNSKIDVSFLKSGVYIVQISVENQIIKKRFVKK